MDVASDLAGPVTYTAFYEVYDVVGKLYTDDCTPLYCPARHVAAGEKVCDTCGVRILVNGVLSEPAFKCEFDVTGYSVLEASCAGFTSGVNPTLSESLCEVL